MIEQALRRCKKALHCCVFVVPTKIYDLMVNLCICGVVCVMAG